MRLLTFVAGHFGFKTHSRTLEEVPLVDVEDEVDDAVVAFLHVERRDQGEARPRAFRKTLKHIKWVANKSEMTHIVLHSFTHLGGENAEPDFARQLIADLAQRLESTGYAVKCTPFGYFCAWSIDVRGESLAKVYKAF